MRAVLGVVAVLVFLQGPGAAQPAAGDEVADEDAGAGASDEEEARRLFEQAERLYRDKDYERAAQAYLASHERSGIVSLLFNAAQAERLAGRLREAAELYRRFLESPDAELSALAREHLGAIERALAEQESATAEAEEPPKADRDSDHAAPAPPAATTEPAAIVERASPATGRPLRVAGLATAGAGLVALGAGMYYGLEARRLERAIDQHEGPWTPEALAQFSDGERSSTRMRILSGAGAAAVVVGGSLYWLGRRAGAPGARQEARVRAGVEPRGRGAALVIAGSF